jgi:hypothetical protein
MRDPVFEPVPAKHTNPAASQGHGRKLTVACTILAGVWLLCLSIEGPRRSTCAACRLDHIERGFLGFRWSKYEESDCSRWYAANVESGHPHIWARGAHCRRFGIPGIYSGYACSIGEPIAGLAKSAQLRVYQRFRDPMKAKQIFVRLGNWDSETPRLMTGLCEWADSGDPESWDEWWAKHQGQIHAG